MDVAPAGEGKARESTSSGGGEVSEREAALAELAVGARGHAGRARAASTERGYAEDWTRFRLWCVDMNLDALPADPLTVALYLTHLAPTWRPATNDDPPGAVAAGEVLDRVGLAPGSIARHLASISVHHRSAGHPSPARDPRVLDVLSGIPAEPADDDEFVRRVGMLEQSPFHEVSRLSRVRGMLVRMTTRARLPDDDQGFGTLMITSGPCPHSHP